jgi:hypothetical protein
MLWSMSNEGLSVTNYKCPCKVKNSLTSWILTVRAAFKVAVFVTATIVGGVHFATIDVNNR